MSTTPAAVHELEPDATASPGSGGPWRFLIDVLTTATEGSLSYWAWLITLFAVLLVGLNAWSHQIAHGLVLTEMNDHVAWGLYLGNFTYCVGLAAGAVMVVIPTYLYRNEAMHKVVIVGEILAISAICACILFVSVDVGRVERFWHLVPGIGETNFPASLLNWDVIALWGYLCLNAAMVLYVLYERYHGRQPSKRVVVPLAMVSIVWAISIHVVTAFLYSGFGARPFWNHAILAPRFIASAFITGPAFLLLAFEALRQFAGVSVAEGPSRTLLKILRVTVLINLFFLGSEIFTVFYTGGEHADSARYLFFGLHGASALVPGIWTAIALNIAAAAVFLFADPSKHHRWIIAAASFTLVGVWFEKGMGLLVPGFIPSTLHEVVEYLPNALEWRVTAGIWALCLIMFTIGLKVAFAVLTGELRAPAGPRRS